MVTPLEETIKGQKSLFPYPKISSKCMERRHGQRGVESAEGRHDMHEILQLFRHAFRDPTAAVRRRGGRAPCMIRDPTAAVRRAAVAHHA